VTGTPVLSSNSSEKNILYVVSAVASQNTNSGFNVNYYLHAIDVTNGHERPGSPVLIQATVSGHAPGLNHDCESSSDRTGAISFDPTHHLQRPGLLLLSNAVSGDDAVYIGFGPVFGETQNGWVFGYTYNAQNGFTQRAAFVTTPYGTG